MRPHSLRLRLILIAALAIVIALTAASVGLTALFADHIQRATVRSLTSDLNRLAALVDTGGAELALTQPMADPRFDVPYGGIYWQVRDPASGETIRSRSMWDKSFGTTALATSANAPVVFALSDPEGTPAVAVGRLLSFELDNGGVRPLELIVAEDNEASEAAIGAYRLDLVKALAVLGVLLVLAAWAQVSVGLSPLKAVRRGVAAIRAGEATTMTGSYPSEVQPLVSEVNELTQAQETAIQFARARASDLAHGLKGHLQVLVSEAHELRRKGDEAAAGTIEALAQDMAGIVDHQLRLTRLRRRTAVGAAGSDLGATTDRIVHTVRRTSRGAQLDWYVDIAEHTGVALDGPDLAELLGALVENASKWAKARVRIRGGTISDSVEFSIDDDGPGMTDAQIARLGERGVRLDETRSGSGLGISIAREIVALNGGTLAFSRAELGGLAVTVRLPAASLAGNQPNR